MLAGVSPDPVRRGVRLFNFGRYLSAQQVWEDIWRAAPAEERPFLEGLVQLAAALHLRTRRGATRGAVHLLSQGPGDRIPTGSPKRARIDQAVTLVVAIETADGRLFAGTPRVNLGRGARAAETSPPVGLEVAWFKVEATGQAYDNEKGGAWHWDPIDYAETPWPGAGGLARPADAHPTQFPDTHGGLGTMRYKVAVTLGGKTVATPGAESRFRGGIGVQLTSVRRRQVKNHVLQTRWTREKPRPTLTRATTNGRVECRTPRSRTPAGP